jgi:hypothetical protein
MAKHNLLDVGPDSASRSVKSDNKRPISISDDITAEEIIEFAIKVLEGTQSISSAPNRIVKTKVERFVNSVRDEMGVIRVNSREHERRVRAKIIKPTTEKTTRQIYTESELRQALFDCFSGVKNVSKAAKDCGIGSSTVYRHRNTVLKLLGMH